MCFWNAHYGLRKISEIDVEHAIISYLKYCYCRYSPAWMLMSNLYIHTYVGDVADFKIIRQVEPGPRWQNPVWISWV